MDIIASRTRIFGAAPRYSYRALAPLDQIDPARRHRVAILHVQTQHNRLPCTRIADTIAPDRWFERNLAVPCGLAARLNLVGRRVEAILLRSVSPRWRLISRRSRFFSTTIRETPFTRSPPSTSTRLSMPLRPVSTC